MHGRSMVQNIIAWLTHIACNTQFAVLTNAGILVTDSQRKTVKGLKVQCSRGSTETNQWPILEL